jgi:spore maturation protein CgeB
VKIAYFTHSLASCWNHGNAHFLRGVLRELIARGHHVEAHEPDSAWSLVNLLRDHGEAGLAAFRAAYPELRCKTYKDPAAVVERVADADLVIAHEWNHPALVAALGAARKRGARFTLLFHDTHHRAVSDSGAMRQFDLGGYDAILAFGETLAAVYRRWGWGGRVHVWHEAADIRHFRPPAANMERRGLVWIGNWGDGERGAELETFLLRPAGAARLPLDIHGVRYPDDARAMLTRHGATFKGWAPNAAVPALFARYLATIHVPRRFYVKQLPGIPTIRVFEALACGIPLVCSPWEDRENLFRPGEDYLVAETSERMERHLVALRGDPALRETLAHNGLEAIANRHTCGHRVDALLAIVATLRAGATRAAETEMAQ